MRIPPLVVSLLSSKQDCVAAIDPHRPSTSSSTCCATTTITPPPPPLPPAPLFPTSKAYRQVKRDCLRKGQLFVDLDFPPTNESLFLDEKSWTGAELEIEWKRPGEIVDNPKLFVEGASPFDVTQGILGNCWFVSACSALTHNEALLQKVIPDAQGQEWAADRRRANCYAGIFQFCFWRFGRWVDVLIDDLLPCKDGKLLFARSKTPNEFWSALLEKAFAKLYGCYENLVGGQLADALQDVSGGVAEGLNVHKFLTSSQQSSSRNGRALLNSHPMGTRGPGHFLFPPPSPQLCPPIEGTRRLFYILKHAFDREALIVAAIAAKKEEVERSLDCGLVMGHAYAVTAIRYIELDAVVDKEMPDRGEYPLGKRQAMVRLQNPWGEKEWNGPWSDGSTEWEQVTEAQKRRLGITVDEDGEFWMPWDQFVRYFTDISVCQMFNTESVDPCLKRRMSIKASRRSNATIGMPDKQFREWIFFGQWSNNGVKSGAPRDRAGGCLNFPATFCFNPQFVFDVPPGAGPAEVMFALSQKDQFVGGGRKKRGKQRQPYLVVGLHLMRVELNRRHRIHQAINPVSTSEYSSGRSVYLHLAQLPPGRYVLIPSTYAPREEAEFMLRIYSTAIQLNPMELEEDVPNGRRGVGFPKCAIRARCVTRVRIFDAEMGDQLGKECDLFCRLIAKGGQQVRTNAVSAEPGHPVKFHESFLFHGHCPIQKFMLEVWEQRRRRDKCLGRAKLTVVSDQNDCLVTELQLKGPKRRRGGGGEGDEAGGEGSTKKLGGGMAASGATAAQIRIQVCSYDDPLYL